MKEYLELVKKVLFEGKQKEDRTGTGTFSIFGYQYRVNLNDGFPLLTTKKLHLKSIIHELLWMLSGDSNIKYLKDNGVSIWDEWADENGDLGPVYGHQWRHWSQFLLKKEITNDLIRDIRSIKGIDPDVELAKIIACEIKENSNFEIDQISNVIDQIKTNPDSRRLIVSAWNVADIEDMALPPCHLLFQFYVQNGKLSCQLYQRSGDVGIGIPFNLAFYSLLTMMVAKVCDLELGEFIHTIGDAHIYENHVEPLIEQIKREPRVLPIMEFPKKESIFDYKYEDFKLIGYDPHPHIKMEVSV